MSTADSLRIDSDRLSLVSLLPETLEAILGGDFVRAGELLGTDGAVVWDSEFAGLELRLSQLAANPGLQPFLLRAMILKASRVVVGHIGFHWSPDAAYLSDLGLKGLEFGYTVFPAYRRQGLAREAAAALMGWAHREHGVEDFVLSIAPVNEPSLRIARHFGFDYHSVYNDPADGVEHVYVGKIDRK